MTEGLLLDIGLVVVFVLVGGVFAGTEIALVSLRESQVDQLEERGPRGARVAAVARDPNRFLAAVQIGVTLAGFLSAAFGASTLAPYLTPVLVGWGLSEGLAQTLTLVVLTLAIAYLSLVLGELVPKRLALQRSSAVALAVAPAVDRFATFVRPVIWLLSRSTDAVVRLLGGDPQAAGEEMSDEELRRLVLSHEAIPRSERALLGDVFDAFDRTVGEVMRPRHDVVFLPADLTVSEARRRVAEEPYSRYPVIGADFDDVLGFAHVRDLYEADGEGRVRDVARSIVVLPPTSRLLPALSTLRRERVHIAAVIDEYGGTDGIVTLEDLVEELVGEIQDEHDRSIPVAVDAGGGVVVDAGLNLEDFRDAVGVALPDEGAYETVGGYVLSRLGRVAVAGDVVGAGEHELEVLEVEGNHIERIRVRRGA
ncbi:MAG TPA: hemolysin family protein [Phycicoccus sp.]|nr:hemolysin family protein [Phycicoccus sp.]